jgi:hypothetical protein
LSISARVGLIASSTSYLKRVQPSVLPNKCMKLPGRGETCYVVDAVAAVVAAFAEIAAARSLCTSR